MGLSTNGLVWSYPAMSDVLSLQFDDASEPLPGLAVHRLGYEDALSQPFLLKLVVSSTDAAIDPKLVLGKGVRVDLEGEPWLAHLRGLVVGFEQLTSLGGLPHGASAYTVRIRPPLWLLSRRFGRRIHQDATADGIIAATLAGLGGVVPQPTLKIGRTLQARPYTAQYDETDLGFVRRILAEHHLVAFFDPTADGAWTVADDLASAACALPTPLMYRPPTGQVPSHPHALSLSTRDELGATHASLRDYTFEHPQLARSAPAGLDGVADVEPAPNERGSHEALRVGRFRDDRQGSAIAERELAALRSKDHVVTMVVNFAMPAGTRFTLLDHPRADLGHEFVVIGAQISIDDGVSFDDRETRTPLRRYHVTCVQRHHTHFEEPIARPRVPATEIGFVVGDGPEGTVEVDAYGRVKVELLWDRRDLRHGNPTTWVRVSQGWAGPNRGLVTLPRIGDEVLIGYIGGDPDEPFVVGRAHNALARTPLALPDPDRSVSVWRSRTIGGDGYNEILMDDAAGKERLWLRAEREHKLHVKGSSLVQVDGDSQVRVGGDATVEVTHDLVVKSETFTQETGPYEARTTRTVHSARDSMRLESDTITLEASSKIELICGGTQITLTPGAISIKGGDVTVEGGTVKIASSVVTDIDGPLITLN